MRRLRAERLRPGGFRRGAAGEQGREQAGGAGRQDKRRLPAPGESGDHEPGQAGPGGGDTEQQEQRRQDPVARARRAGGASAVAPA